LAIARTARVHGRAEVAVNDSQRTYVVIGGGFAGAASARLLAYEDRVRVTLVDKNEYQQFRPLLYQMATGELSRHDMAFDLRNIIGDIDGPDRVPRLARVHAELLSNAGADLEAFVRWAEEFYLRPHHRSAELLDPTYVPTVAGLSP